MITTRKILTKKSTTGDLKAYHQLEKSTMKIEVTTFNHKEYRPNPKVVISKVDSITCTRSWLGLLMTVDLPTIKFFQQPISKVLPVPPLYILLILHFLQQVITRRLLETISKNLISISNFFFLAEFSHSVCKSF